MFSRFTSRRKNIYLSFYFLVIVCHSNCGTHFTLEHAETAPDNDARILELIERTSKKVYMNFSMH